ncbi:MAG: hypothetical protein ABH863_05295 [Candidatus Micrarchaeota archaeon]
MASVPRSEKNREMREFRSSAALAKPVWEISQKPQTESALLRQLVRFHSKVACIGGYGSPSRDPSPKFLARRVRSGNLTLVDVQDNPTEGAKSLYAKLQGRKAELKAKGLYSSDLDSKIIALRPFEGQEHIYGLGGLRSYRKRMRRWPWQHFMKRRIKLLPAFAWDTGMRPRSMDLIIDRGTFYFFGIPGKLPDAANHYLDLLKPGGRAVFFLRRATGTLHYRKEVEGILQNEIQKLVSRGLVHARTVRFKKRYLRRLLPAASFYRYREAIVVTKLAQ